MLLSLLFVIISATVYEFLVNRLVIEMKNRTNLSKKINALVSLLEVSIIFGQTLRTTGTPKRPSRSHFNWWLTRDVTD